MVDGWPGRVARSNWGPTMEMEARQRDPRNSLNDDQVNLEFWQVAAMSLCSPKLVMLVDPPQSEPPGTLLFGAFTWDDTVLVDQPVGVFPSFVTVTYNSQTDIEFEFDATVPGRPDENGVQQQEPLAFQFGFADINVQGATTERWFAEFELINPKTFRVQTFRGAVSDDNPFLVAVW